MVGNFLCRSANAFPRGHTSDVLSTDDVSERVAESNPMQEPEGGAEIALARRVGADQQSQLTQGQGPIAEVLEIGKMEGLDHGLFFPGKTGVGSGFRRRTGQNLNWRWLSSCSTCLPDV